jgi:hypothetical protein
MIAREIAALVSMPRLLGELGFRVSERTHRSICILHGGKTFGAFSWRDDGVWYCFACGRGGDKLSLVQEAKRCDFKTALRFLAALAGVEIDETAKFKEELARARRERKRLEIEQARFRAIERQVLLRTRDNAIALERLYRNASSRLSQLNAWECERFVGEEDLAWAALALVAAQMPRAAAAYTAMAFGNSKLRTAFAQHPEQRGQIIQECLVVGGVCNDQNHFVDVVL